MKLSIIALVWAVSFCAVAADNAPGHQEASGPALFSTNELPRILGEAACRPCAATASNLYANCIVLLKPGGNLKARFDVVNTLSTEYELMSRLAECLIASRVRVRKQADGSYLYSNEEDEKYIIQVIHDESGPDHFRGVYYITGRMMFAELRALMHLESRPNAEGGIEYAARIYAGSDSHILNFFARIRFIRNLLIGDVNTVVSKFDSVYDELLKDPRSHFEEVKKHRDPAADPYFPDREIEITRQLVNKLLAGQPASQGSDK